MTQQDPQKVFRETRHECLKATKFEQPLSEGVRLAVQRAMKYTSFMGLGVEFPTYRRIASLANDLNLFEIEVLLKILLAATPNELCQTTMENVHFIETEAIPLRDAFCLVDDEISKKVAKEINAKIAMQETVPDKKKLFIPDRRIVGIQ